MQHRDFEVFKIDIDVTEEGFGISPFLSSIYACIIHFIHSLSFLSFPSIHILFQFSKSTVNELNQITALILSFFWGTEHKYDIVHIVFQYLELLKRAKPQEWIFNEVSILNIL